MIQDKRQFILNLPWLLLFFSIPVFPFLVSASAALVVISFFFRYRELRLRFKGHWLLLIPVLFYLYHLAGLSWTEVKDAAFPVAERKFSFLLFPLLFLFLPPLGKTERRMISGAFIAGAFLHSAISLAGASVCYAQEGTRDCFFSSAFSFLLHPSYSSLYAVTILAFLGTELVDRAEELSRREKTTRILLIAWFVIIVLLLASKAGLISLVFISIFLVIYFLARRKKIKQGIMALGIILLLGTATLVFTSVPLERFQQIFSSAGMSEQELFEKYRESTESTPVRRMIWSVSKEIIAENPFGVGSGDVQRALMEKYKEKGMTGAYAHELNAHSQYFQTGVGLGYPGLALLALLLLLPAVSAIRQRNFLFLAFLVLSAINLAVESMFETQAGVVFFALFFCFFYCGKKISSETQR